MDAIVTAGGIPQPDDPLYPHSNGSSKAMIDMAGKPMIQWVLDAMSDARKVERVIIVGLSPKNELTCKKPLYYISNQGRMLANIVTGINKAVELNPKAQYVLLVSSDIPALKSSMVDWLISTCMKTRDELYYGVCPRAVMEKRFPGSNRTYTRLKDMEVCGSDINVVHVNQATQHLDTWEQLIGTRKSPLRQAAVIGWDTLFQLFTHRVDLQSLVKQVSQRIGIKGRAIIWSHAEPCMDVDKPHQLELLRADLARQQRKAVRASAPTPKRKSIGSKPLRKTVRASGKAKSSLKTAKSKIKRKGKTSRK
jgi:GTP:adenosylcobinamide-phosphate guanylyltransferase